MAEPAPSAGRRFSGWMIGLFVAAAGAVLTGLITGGITSAGESLWDAITGKEPVKVTVLDPVAGSRTTLHSSSYLFERPIEELGPPPRNFVDHAARDVWAQRHGGLDAWSTDVEVVIEGDSADPVILRGLEVRVLERRPPPRATHVAPPGAGPVNTRYFLVDLDRNPPSIEFGSGQEPAPGERPIEFPYRVSRTDPEVFLILANAERCDCRWVADLHWLSQGKSGTTTIRDGDKPFRTVSARRSDTYFAAGRRFVPER